MNSSFDLEHSPLNDSVLKLEQQLSRKTQDKKSVSVNLTSALSSYVQYLSQLNSNLEKQIRKYQSNLDEDADEDALEDLKKDVAETVRQQAQMKANFESQIAQLQADHARSLQNAVGDERRKRMEAESRASKLERDVREAQRQLEEAKDAAASIQASLEDANVIREQTSSLEKSLRAANERLKEKLVQEQQARERESQAREQQLKKWQQELREAQDEKERATREGRVAVTQVKGLEERAQKAEREKAELSAALTEARASKEEFLYSIQMANERLKEKLRQSEETSAALALQQEEHRRLEQELGRMEGRNASLTQELRVVQEELQRSLRYKDDWMSEVKRRVLLEEQGSTEASALRIQLQQLQQRLQDVQRDRSAVATVDNSQKLAEAERRISDLMAELSREKGADQKLLEEQKKTSVLEAKVEELQAESKRLNATILEKTQELSQATQKLSEEKFVSARSKTDLKDRDAVVEQLNGDLKKLRKQYEELEANLRAEMRKCSSFEIANTQLEKELALFKASHSEDLRERVQELLNTSGSMAQQLDSATSKQEVLLEQLRVANEELNELRKYVAEKEQEATEAAGTAKSWRDRYEKAVADSRKEEDVNRALILKMQTSTEQLQEVQGKVKTLENKLLLIRSGFEAAIAGDLLGARQFASLNGTGDDDVLSRAALALVDAKEKIRQAEASAAAATAAATAAAAASAAVAASVASPVSKSPAPPAVPHVVLDDKEETPAALISRLRDAIEARAGVTFDKFQVLQTALQAHPYGRTTFAKLDIGNNEALWVRVFQTSGGPPALNSAQGPKSIDEALVYFDEWDLNFTKKPQLKDDKPTTSKAHRATKVAKAPQQQQQEVASEEVGGEEAGGDSVSASVEGSKKKETAKKRTRGTAHAEAPAAASSSSGTYSLRSRK